jgi:hypothetical protein
LARPLNCSRSSFVLALDSKPRTSSGTIAISEREREKITAFPKRGHPKRGQVRCGEAQRSGAPLGGRRGPQKTGTRPQKRGCQRNGDRSNVVTFWGPAVECQRNGDRSNVVTFWGPAVEWDPALGTGRICGGSAWDECVYLLAKEVTTTGGGSWGWRYSRFKRGTA